jgi:hypothetical protein
MFAFIRSVQVPSLTAQNIRSGLVNLSKYIFFNLHFSRQQNFRITPKHGSFHRYSLFFFRLRFDLLSRVCLSKCLFFFSIYFSILFLLFTRKMSLFHISFRQLLFSIWITIHLNKLIKNLFWILFYQIQSFFFTLFWS